ncbi:MAG: family 78 glycoside hydrolase catalytic domain [Clostridia bacterium]|nr:family 78 glycoside hydrolase catalytic domain [Clostridia bacterium]
MKVFNTAKWIWVENACSPNTYGEFLRTFTYGGGETKLRVSCDGDYTLFVNGEFVTSGQYGDYEWYKSYDEVDITEYLKAGENTVALLVWHFGESTQRYLLAKAGVIFEIEREGQVCVESDESTLARYSLAYKNGYMKTLSPQLGFSYLYDATKEDCWVNGNGAGFAPAVCVEKNCEFVPRPVKKSVLLQRKDAKQGDYPVKVDGKKYFVLDLGEETVGLLSFAFTSKTAQKILISFGEDLERGTHTGAHVRRKIHNRDFSVEYIAKAGENEYTNYMLRFGCRYLQIECEEDIELAYAGLIPQVYPTVAKPFSSPCKRDEEIYKLCLRSLQLCMMEHYVDCPWREQCLYAYDSRNQMLCGYYAFEGGNYEYVRANLLLMSKDRYPGGLMSICYPCGADLTIPSFSLYYSLSVLEYTEYSKDLTLAKEVYERMLQYQNAVLARRQKDGLLYRFEGKNNWNFYDWSAHADGTLHGEDRIIPDAALNILTVMSLRCFKRVCELAGLEYPYGNTADELAQKTYEAFYHKENGLFSMTLDGGEFVELINALAVRFDIVSGKEAEAICERLAGNELVSCSLSMKTFTYDALLKVNKEKYKGYILAQIRRDYGIMLDNGATATWETLDGASAFDHAGSLCHGWTALPIYYFNKLL